MTTLFKRREWIATLIGSMGSFALAAVGCGKGEESSTTPRNHTITLTFRENNEFYRQLEDELNRSSLVVVEFDGAEKVGKDSRLIN